MNPTSTSSKEISKTRCDTFSNSLLQNKSFDGDSGVSFISSNLKGNYYIFLQNIFVFL